jgi:restriction system protein
MLSKPCLLSKLGYQTRGTMVHYRTHDWADFLYYLLFFAAMAIIGMIWSNVQTQNVKRKKKSEEEKRANAPCKHGIIGALYGSQTCIKCQQEKAAEEQIAIQRAEEEAARRKIEKERAYREWIAKIRLPEYLQKMDPGEFELLVCDLFRRMGYQVEQTPLSGDSGIDGYLRKDGILSILQCKRVKGSVGEPILRDLFGTMHATGAKKGVVVTTGKVSMKALKWSKNKPMKIMELSELVEHIRTFYREDDIIPVNFVPNTSKDSYCPKCGSPMKVVNWEGKRFLGCSAYPSCRYTTSLPK